MGAAVDIPNMGLPPWSGNACLPCIHNHLGILVPEIGLAEWGRTLKYLERIVCVWRMLSKLEEYCPNWENIVQAGRALSVFGGYCPSWESIVQAGGILSELRLGEHCVCLENIVQAVRILKQLESNFLPTPATQIEPSMATGWREIRIKGIQVKNMNFVCKRKSFLGKDHCS